MVNVLLILSDALVTKHIELCQRALAVQESNLKSTYQKMFQSPVVPSAAAGASKPAPAANVAGQ